MNNQEYIPGHTGKTYWMSEQQANYVARNNKGRFKMRSYFCSQGEFIHWHITSMTKKAFKEQKKEYKRRDGAVNLRKR